MTHVVRVTTRARDWVRQLAERPFHAALGAFVVGLVGGSRWPELALGLAIVLLVSLTRARRPVSLAAIVALVAGAAVGHARARDRDGSTLQPQLGHVIHVPVTLLEAARARVHGGKGAMVQVAGDRVWLYTAASVAWPHAPVGVELDVTGILERPSRNEAWLSARGVDYTLEAERVHLTGRRRGGLMGAVDTVRTRAEDGLTRGLPPPQAALLRGMALGQDEDLPPALRQDFRAAGLSHLTAASGQNVALLATLVLTLCGWIGVGWRSRLGLVLALIALYVPLAGAGPSIQRAGVMGAAAVVAMIAGRPAARWYALLLAAAVTLVIDPRAIEQPGWQLSFAAVVTIFLLGGRLRDALGRKRVPHPLAEAVAMTAAAMIGTAPVIALHFDRVSLVALPANVLAAPAVPVIMWLGLAASAVAQVSVGLALPFTLIAAVPLRYLAWLGHVAASVPGAKLAMAPVPAALVSAGAVAALVWRRARALAVAGLVAIVAGLAVAQARTPSRRAAPAVARITFLDVGQGDATLLQDHAAAVLIDTGPPDGGIVAQLRHAGVRRLDLLVITHAEADHEGGAQAILNAVPVGLVLDGRDGRVEPLGARIVATANARRVRRVAAAAGQVLRVGRIVIRVLWPPPEPLAWHRDDDPNLRAVVAEAAIGGLRVFLGADAESEVLAGLDLRPVDVLKVSHHGSADPGLPDTLTRLRPSIATIEVGRPNPFGHPTASTLRALQDAGTRVYRTDRDGNVSVEPEGARLRIQTHA